MIMCSCNLLTDAHIREALARPNAPERVREVYASCGCTAKCGGCAASINRLLNEVKADYAKVVREGLVAAPRRDAA